MRRLRTRPPTDHGSAAQVVGHIREDLQLLLEGLDRSVPWAVSPVSEDIEPGQVVASTVTGLVPADRTDPLHYGRVIGVAPLGAEAGSQGLVITTGFVNELFAELTVGGRLWLDVNGELRDTPPQDGFQQEVAVAVGTRRLVVSLGVPIKLA